MYSGNKTNSSAILKSFYQGGDGELKPLNETWKMIVAESANICEIEIPTKTLEIPTNIEDGTVYYFYYYNNFVECIRVKNFVNCPDEVMRNTTECQKLGDLISKCNTTDYALTHQLFYEDFYYHPPDNSTEISETLSG